MKPQMKRRGLVGALAALLVVGAAGCGRKGDLKPVDSTKKKAEKNPSRNNKVGIIEKRQ